MKTLTAEILNTTKNIFPLQHLTQTDHLFRLFPGYFVSLDQDPSKSTASRYYTGTRLLPLSLVRHYADKDVPICPNSLYDEVSMYIDISHTYPSDLLRTQNALRDFIDLLPPEDREEFLCDPLPARPSKSDISDLLTRLLWYAICCDYYEGATTKQVG